MIQPFLGQARVAFHRVENVQSDTNVPHHGKIVLWFLLDPRLASLVYSLTHRDLSRSCGSVMLLLGSNHSELFSNPVTEIKGEQGVLLS